MMQHYEIKRFLEYWSADQAFREHYAQDPAGAVALHHLEVDPQACRVLVDAKMAAAAGAAGACDAADAASAAAASQVHPGVLKYRHWIKAKIADRTQHREDCATSNPVFAAWRGAR